MNIYLVDVKNEYTAHLIRLLTPLIYEGIQSIYDKAKESMEEQSLKLFQEFLSDIPSWNTTLINQESDRIKSGTKPYFEDLIKATIKANIMLLVFNPFNDKQQTIDIELYKKIKTSTFIHNVYIECAREFWNNPFLLFHKYAAIDTKRNQRESLNIIKDCIKEAIRKLLPIEDIIKVYLSDNINQETEQKIAQNLKDFTENDPNHLAIIKDSEIKPIDIMKKLISDNASVIKEDLNSIKKNNEDKQNRVTSIQTDKTIDSKVIENDNDVKEHTSTSSIEINGKKLQVGGRYSTTENLINKIEKKINSNNSVSINNKSLDSKLEEALGDTDIDTSLNYNVEKNMDDYQEIYGNK
jgi:flagellin-specific chaperone FliS